MCKIKTKLFYLLLISSFLCEAFSTAHSQIKITSSKNESTTWLRNNRFVPDEWSGSAIYYEDPYYGIEKVEKPVSLTGTEFDDPYRPRQGSGGSESRPVFSNRWVPYYNRPSNCASRTYQPEANLNLRMMDAPPASRQAIIVYQPRALYSKEDYLARRQGTIKLQVQLKASGAVGSIRPLSKLPGKLAESAIQAACYLTFYPAFAGGKPIDSVRTISYTFAPDQVHDNEAAKYPAPPAPNSNVVIISRQRAFYTPDAKQNQVQGNVVLRVTFLASGKIGAVVPVKELPDGLTEKAIEAARQMEFDPARKNGKNITQIKTIVYNFTLY